MQFKFLGHIITSKGIKPDPARSEAVRKMPAPTDVSSLRSFLGAINYYGRFIKQMREIRGPLDELLKKDSQWEWSEKQQKAFEKAKEILSSDLLLTHFDPILPIVVAADASQRGIGATISHIFPDKTEKIIEHASLSFTPAQRNYSQIEKEGLALVFAVQKFHRMLTDAASHCRQIINHCYQFLAQRRGHSDLCGEQTSKMGIDSHQL